MISIPYAPHFLRQVRALPLDLQEAICEAIDIFQDPHNHKSLKVHKLHGRLQNKWSFSIDYRMRIVFMYGKTKQEAILLAVGNHEIYK